MCLICFSPIYLGSFLVVVRKLCVSYNDYSNAFIADPEDFMPELEKPKPTTSGLFGISEDHLESYQSLDERFVKNKTSTFFFEAEGESMMPLIWPRDVLVVDRVLAPEWGRVVVVVWDEELICKRLVREGKRIILRSENSRFADLVISNERSFVLWGVVRAIIHPLIEQEARKR